MNKYVYDGKEYTVRGDSILVSLGTMKARSSIICESAESELSLQREFTAKMEGTILAIGGEITEFKPGDVVFFKRYAGTDLNRLPSGELDYKKELLRIMKDFDILGFVRTVETETK